MPKAADAFIDFDGDFSRIQKNAGGQAHGLESTFNSSFKRIAAFAAGAIATIGIGRVFKDAFDEARESQKVTRQTAAVLKSTGGIAKVSAKQVDALATSLSNVAGVDDEVIAQGENVLLTFTNIRNQVGAGNNIFDQATTAAVNLSAALGTDLQGSVIQIGKALNDPIKGVTALQRVGVSFTKQQKEQIKTLVESGKTLEAQKIILKELGTEFGGAAAAAADPSARLGVAFKNIEESLGLLFLPLLEKVASFLGGTVAPAIERVIPIIKALGGIAAFAFKQGFGGESISGIHGWLAIFAKVGAALRGFIDFIRGDVASAGVQLGKVFGLSEDDPRVKTFIKVLGTIRKAIVAVVQFVAKHWKPIFIGAAVALGLLFAPITTIAAGLLFLYLRFKVVRDVVKTVAHAIIVAFDAVVSWFKDHQETFQQIGEQFLSIWQAVVPALKAAFTAIIAVVRVALGAIILFWNTFGHTILDVLRGTFNALAQIVRGALQIITGIMEVVTAIFTGKWSKVWDGVKHIFEGVWTVLGGIVKAAWALIHAAIEAGFIAVLAIFDVGKKLIHDAWFGIWHGLHDVVAGIWGGIERTIGSAVNRIIDIINGIIRAFNRLPGPDIDPLGHVNWAESSSPTGPSPRDETGQSRPGSRGVAPTVVTPPRPPPGINAIEGLMAANASGGRAIQTTVDGSRFDAALQAMFDEHDDQISHALMAGAR